MFNIADLAKAEWFIECGGIDSPPMTTVLYQDCCRCKSKEFEHPAKGHGKKYSLGYNNSLEIEEIWNVVCAKCGLRQSIHIITVIPQEETHPRREMLMKAMFVEEVKS